MRTIKLYGELGKKFGKIHQFDVKSPAEAIRAMIANFPEFESFVGTSGSRNVGYVVRNGDVEIDETELHQPATRVIKFIPKLIGSSGATKIIIGAALIAVGAVMTSYGVPGGNFFINAGIALTLGGVAQLLVKTPKTDQGNQNENKPSYIFNGAQNTSQQGVPVPLAYGELIVGSCVISANISIDQIMAGYRYVDHLTYVDIVAKDNETNYQVLTPPENFIRKELLDHVLSDPAFDYSETWYFRFYYNERVLEAVPV